MAHKVIANSICLPLFPQHPQHPCSACLTPLRHGCGLLKITKVAWHFHALLLTQRIPKMVVHKLRLLNRVDTFHARKSTGPSSPILSPCPHTLRKLAQVEP